MVSVERRLAQEDIQEDHHKNCKKGEGEAGCPDNLLWYRHSQHDDADDCRQHLAKSCPFISTTDISRKAPITSILCKQRLPWGKPANISQKTCLEHGIDTAVDGVGHHDQHQQALRHKVTHNLLQLDPLSCYSSVSTPAATAITPNETNSPKAVRIC